MAYRIQSAALEQVTNSQSLDAARWRLGAPAMTSALDARRSMRKYDDNTYPTASPHGRKTKAPIEPAFCAGLTCSVSVGLGGKAGVGPSLV